MRADDDDTVLLGTERLLKKLKLCSDYKKWTSLIMSNDESIGIDMLDVSLSEQERSELTSYVWSISSWSCASVLLLSKIRIVDPVDEWIDAKNAKR